MVNPLLQVENIHTYYGNIHALHGISLYVNPGEIVTLIGSNGAGKSTTIRTISGIMHPRQGTILFDGQPIHTIEAHDLVSRGISQSPEGRRIFPRLTVRDNLEMGAFKRNDKKEILSDIEMVYGLFPRLKERHNQLGGTLSGGEQQMLAIGRALMAHPDFLLLDEPSLGLAPQIIEKIFEIIIQINKEGKTILLVEQNALQALQVAHHGLVLESGRIALQGLARDLLVSDEVKRSYLGI